jgi:hypothetical protein
MQIKSVTTWTTLLFNSAQIKERTHKEFWYEYLFKSTEMEGWWGSRIIRELRDIGCECEDKNSVELTEGYVQ